MPSTQSDSANNAPSIDPYAPVSDPPDDSSQAYVKFSSPFTGDHYYPARPGSTLGSVQQESRYHRFPGDYDNVLAHANLPIHSTVNRKNVFRPDNMHSSRSKISWHPNGRDGPDILVNKLPFFVDTDQDGKSVSRYEADALPHPSVVQHAPPSPQQSSPSAQPSHLSSPTGSGSAKRGRKVFGSVGAQLAHQERKRAQKTRTTRSGLPWKPWQHSDSGSELSSDSD